MPKKAKELSATEVRRLTCSVGKDGEPYNTLHPVGGVSGLYLQVTPSGAKTWLLRTMIGTKRRAIGLGGFPDVSLAEARQKAKEYKQKIQDGIDPVEERKAARRALIASQMSTITFDQAVNEYMKLKGNEFKNKSQYDQWVNSLKEYASPHIGNMPVREIELPQIKAVLDPIWETKNPTAKNVIGRIENILGWCAVHGYRSNENPARWKGYLDKVYLPVRRKVRHHPALDYNQMAEFMSDLKKRTGTAARALEFLILTGARTAEVKGDNTSRRNIAPLTWKEIDLDKGIWVIPKERMKMEREHSVPLSPEAVRLLKSMPQGGPDDIVFPGPRGGVASNNFLRALITRMHESKKKKDEVGYIDPKQNAMITAHGMRSTFRDWMNDCTNYPREIKELALAHDDRSESEAAYSRSDFLKKRRPLMNEWSKFCYTGRIKDDSGKVVAIGSAG